MHNSEKDKQKNRIDNYPNDKGSSNNKISKDAWNTLIILSLIGVIIVYSETMLIPAIPDLINDFGIKYNTISWILTGYLISGAVATPIAGKLSDVYGKKKMAIIVMLIYTVGSFTAIFSPDIVTMIISRITQGIGMSVFPIALSIIRDKFPENKLAIGQGIFTSLFAVGGVIGLSLGAMTTEYFGWRSTFVSITPISLILTFIIMKYITTKKENNDSKKTIKKNIDLKSIVTLTISISSFLIAITLIGDLNISDLNNVSNNHDTLILIILFSISSIISLTIFIIVQKRIQNPLIDLYLLKDKILLPTNILLMLIGTSLFMIYQTISIFIRNPSPVGFGGSVIDAANIQLPFMILALLVSIMSGFLITKFGNIKPTIIGCIVSIIGFFSLYLYHSTEFELIINLSIIATGLALAEIGGFNITLVSVSTKLSGSSMGITTLLFFIGMSIGPAISGIYLETFRTTITLDGLTKSSPSSFSFDLIFLTATLMCVLSLILSLVSTKKIRAKKIFYQN
ncbi:MAG: MFS transporter [Nitrososphaeraceae archaeon]